VPGGRGKPPARPAGGIPLHQLLLLHPDRSRMSASEQDVRHAAQPSIIRAGHPHGVLRAGARAHSCRTARVGCQASGGTGGFLDGSGGRDQSRQAVPIQYPTLPLSLSLTLSHALAHTPSHTLILNTGPLLAPRGENLVPKEPCPTCSVPGYSTLCEAFTRGGNVERKTRAPVYNRSIALCTRRGVMVNHMRGEATAGRHDAWRVFWLTTLELR